MDVTLKNFTKTLPKELLQLAGKNKVRECDETEKGHYVAYVDEGDESNDVSVTVAASGKLAAYTCDCKNNNGICRHVAALLMHIAGDKKIKPAVKAPKKQSQTDTLLAELDAGELRDWIKAVFLKNKEIELAFVQHFSAPKLDYTTEEVVKITNDAIKVAVGNKKTVDPTQIKRLVDLWAQVHAPIIEQYRANVTDPKLFGNVHTLLETCIDYRGRINTTSSRLTKYISGVLEGLEAAVNVLYADEAWEAAVKNIVSLVPKEPDQVRLHYIVHLGRILPETSTGRQVKLIDMLMSQYQKSNFGRVLGGATYTQLLFQMVDICNLFGKYIAMFRPIRYEQTYNLRLIRVLIDNGELKTAASFCREQINFNVREEFDIPYFELMREIYTLTGKKKELAEVMSVLLPLTFDFDDYLYIVSNITDAEGKRLIARTVSQITNVAKSGVLKAIDFVFRHMEHERSFLKMIRHIDSTTPYTLILRYFEPMVLKDKLMLLEAMLTKYDNYYRTGEGQLEVDIKCFPLLYDAVLKHFSEEVLGAAIKAQERLRSASSLNYFCKYMKGRLNG